MQTEPFLEDLKTRISNVNAIYSERFKPLEESKLVLKPSEDSWSIIECIEHLNITSRIYIPQFEEVVADQNYQSQSQTFRRGLLGRLSANHLRPKKQVVRFKINTFKSLEPMKEGWDVVKIKGEFDTHILSLEHVIIASRSINIGKPKITTAFGSVLKFRFADALDFVVAHMERHLVQMERIANQIN